MAASTPRSPMLLLEPANVERYLRESGRLRPGEMVDVQRLSGGISNEVFHVRSSGPAGDFVLKQARSQLRTPDPWFCSVERIWREVDVLRVCEEVLRSSAMDTPLAGAARASCAPAATVPRILFEDRENYLFAMTAAPREHVVWKQQLLAGQVEPEIAARCGQLLARLHAGTWRDPEVERRLGDRQMFHDLRIDPYYLAVARSYPADAPRLQRLAASLDENSCALVHADFSPKNLLVYAGGLMMVDFETGHYGDPAFDLGFFLSHLVLKAFYRAEVAARFSPEPAATGRQATRPLPHDWGRSEAAEPLLELTTRFWETYGRGMAARISGDEYTRLVRRGIEHLAGCLWARLDGKSRVEYLVDSPERGRVRELVRQLFRQRPEEWEEVLSLCREALKIAR